MATNWLSLLQPDCVLEDSILGLTPELVKKNHLQGLILDVDETLVPMNEPHLADEVRHHLEQLKPLVALWLVSNNPSATRIRRIAESLQLPYLASAGKPSRRKLRQALTAMQLPPEQVGMVGDRLFTDVLAGNRLGLFTVLVEPMVSPTKGSRFLYLRDCEVWISQLLGVSLKQLS